jgi:2-polyprenyl-6-methoxyphenol hydroxylase-like FAD-dependent oxidoreductase
MRVLIAGAGVGGLALALSLHERGIPCTVFESAAEVRELGVGINSLPHAVAELAALGLLPALDAVAIRTRTLAYANRFGQEICAEPRGMFAGHAVPQFSIHRGRLQGVLLAAARQRLGEAAIRTGHRLLEFAQDGAGVTARFAIPGGEVAEAGDVLVGADGIHSVVRAALHPDDGGIRWTGIQLWRGAVEWPAWRGGDHMLVAGDMNEKLVLYPIAPGASAATRLTNWAVAVRLAPDAPPPPREDWSRRAAHADVLPHLARFSLADFDLPGLVAATEEIFEYPMADRDPLPWWTRGRVTLLGDAAHPMYPTGSNGSAQAILDARCLARMLDGRDTEEALQAYEAERRAMTTEIVLSNRRGGPERVLDVVSERAPAGFDRIEDVISAEELRAIGLGYATMAGFATGGSRGG